MLKNSCPTLARPDPVPYSELLSQILSFENRLDLLTQSGGGDESQSFANLASRGGSGRNSGYRDSGHGRGPQGGRSCSGANGRGRGQITSKSGGTKPRYQGRCQVYFKEGHSAATCWHLFDVEYVQDEKTVNSTAHGYGADGAWYTDTGETDHITSELDNLVIHDKRQ